MSIDYRKKFLEEAKHDLQNPSFNKIAYLIEKAVKTKNKELIEYENIVATGTPKNDNFVDKQELKVLLEKIYDYWIENNIKEKYKTANNEYEKQQYKDLIDDCEYYKVHKDEFDIFDFWNFYGDRWIGGIKSPVYFQGNYFCHLYANTLSKDRLKFDDQFYEAKLYLNVKLKNRVELAEKLMKNAVKIDIPLTFKFAFQDNRNDNMVFYTYYKNINLLVELVEKTKTENPKLFDGCKVKNPLMATYKGFIGFGEEPYIYGSFNSVRVDVLECAYDILSKQYAQDKGCLTKENIKLAFDNACEKNQVDKDNFCLNILPDCFAKEM